MNKYFIEYPKYQLYVRSDGFVNLKFEYNNNEYLFTEFIPKNNRLVSAFKRVLQLKDKNNARYLVLCMIIDQFNLDPKKDKQGEFKFNILPKKDKDLKFGKEKNPGIHIFTDERHYDNTYPGKMIFNRLKKKLPEVWFDF